MTPGRRAGNGTRIGGFRRRRGCHTRIGEGLGLKQENQTVTGVRQEPFVSERAVTATNARTQHRSALLWFPSIRAASSGAKQWLEKRDLQRFGLPLAIIILQSTLQSSTEVQLCLAISEHHPVFIAICSRVAIMNGKYCQMDSYFNATPHDKITSDRRCRMTQVHPF
jgi:hypothetical protein